jgi:hypothetical protein
LPSDQYSCQKKIIGFINGKEKTNARTVLKGIPVAIKESHAGIAAYEGREKPNR